MRVSSLAREMLANVAMRSPRIAARRNRAGRYASALNPAVALSQFAFIRDKLGPVEGKVVAEVGAGDTLPLGLLLLGAGASKYIDVDRFPGDVAGKRARVLYAELARIAPEDVRRGWGRLGRRPEEFPWEDLVVMVPKAIESIDPTRLGPVDAIISFKVLEHLLDPLAAFVGMAAALPPGGRMVHRIDYGPHDLWVAEPAPLDFLCPTEWLWDAMGSARGMPNRWRHPEIMAALDAAGFDAIADITNRFTVADIARSRPRLARRFRDIPDEGLIPKDAMIVAVRR